MRAARGPCALQNNSTAYGLPSSMTGSCLGRAGHRLAIAFGDDHVHDDRARVGFEAGVPDGSAGVLGAKGCIAPESRTNSAQSGTEEDNFQTQRIAA